jgi:mono/diheme cytochrome c family protein
LINRKFIWIVIILVVSIGLYYFITLGFESKLNSNYETDNESLLLQGERVYREHCMRCHGRKGAGGIAPPLLAYNADRDTIQKGKLNEGMPSFENILSPDEISSILEYLKS